MRNKNVNKTLSWASEHQHTGLNKGNNFQNEL